MGARGGPFDHLAPRARRGRVYINIYIYNFFFYSDALHREPCGLSRLRDELIRPHAQWPRGRFWALDRAQYADLKFWLPGDILTKGRSHPHGRVSLEARVAACSITDWSNSPRACPRGMRGARQAAGK